MSSTAQTKALLLRSVDYGESDRILTLLTHELGKVGAFARGARRSRRRFAGALQPFQVIGVTLRRRQQGSLLTLGEAEVQRPFMTIPSSPAKYAHASLAVELVRELTPMEEAEAGPYALLEGYLATLDRERADLRLLSELVLSALTLAGIAPALARCASCAKKAPPARAASFDFRRGIVCTACGGAPTTMRGPVRAALLAATAGESLPGIEEADLAEGLDHLLNFAREHLGRDLKSRALLAVGA